MLLRIQCKEKRGKTHWFANLSNKSGNIMKKPEQQSVISSSEIDTIVSMHVPPGVVRKNVQDMSVFVAAFTPRWVNRHTCYERLEFLGDSVLSAVITSYLYIRYPSEDEGFLTSVRSKLVSGAMLSRLAANHTPFGEFVRRIVARFKPPSEHIIADKETTTDKKVLEDVFEAFLGAMFLDMGFDVVSAWLVGFIEKYVDFAEVIINKRSAKHDLNTFYRQKYGYIPTFQTVSENSNATTRVTTTTIRDIYGVILGTGSGNNKVEAEADAAAAVLSAS